MTDLFSTADLARQLNAQNAPPVQELLHDPADNMTALGNAVDPGRDQLFGYDALNRLTAAS